jgi:microtubule-associated protein, RP/EB family
MVESRNDLLRWINSLLGSDYDRIEQLGTGAAYCQIINMIYGDLCMKRVRFDANQESQYIQNFKILQGAFDKHGIEKGIAVERLIKLRCQDNLEFVQWLKKLWDSKFQSGKIQSEVHDTNQEMLKPNIHFKMIAETMEKERDFYFDMLRQIETMVQTQSDELNKEELINQIKQILYNTE